MNRTSSYNELFDMYWQWLLERFRNGIRLEYSPRVVSPGKGNVRRVEYVDEQMMLLRETKETTSRGHQSKCLRAELRDDFGKLYQDPEVDSKLLSILRKQHGIKNLVEFKRHMFEEFRSFARNQPGIEISVEHTSTLPSGPNSTGAIAKKSEASQPTRTFSNNIPTSVRALRVFLCHSSGDKPAVRDLYQWLHSNSIQPWLDEESLLPGQNWEQEIPKAVSNSDVVIVCLSQSTINKRGYVQKEIKYALDVADEQPEGAIFLIPVKIEECSIPDRLKSLHWVNLFEEKGYERLLRALNARADTLGLRVGADDCA